MATSQRCPGMEKSKQLPGIAAKRPPALRQQRRRNWSAQVRLEAFNRHSIISTADLDHEKLRCTLVDRVRSAKSSAISSSGDGESVV
jgi:hypothetical protein